jgi:5-methylcytosine-specific restriction endonuclease McrA
VKKCGRCQQEKPLDQFGKDKHSRDGLTKHCKDCKREFHKSYRENNREKWLADKKASRSRNIKKDLAYKRKYYAEHKQEAADYQREYAKRNPAKVEKIKAVYRSRRLKDCYTVLDREIQRIKGSPCFACGSVERIEVDHVVPLSRGGRHSIGNLMPLCRSCNASKGGKLLVEWKFSRLQ